MLFQRCAARVGGGTSGRLRVPPASVLANVWPPGRRRYTQLRLAWAFPLLGETGERQRLDGSSRSLVSSLQTALAACSRRRMGCSMADVSSRRTSAFVSYCHADAEHLTRLHVHLAPFARQGKVDVWDDTRLRPGMRWKEEIERAIAQAKVAILLVSADFLASEFIASDEVPPLLEAAEREGTLIVPIILSPSGFLRSKLARYQALNDPADPLIDMPRGKQEAIWAKLAEYVADALTPAISKVAEPKLPDWLAISPTGEERRLPVYFLLDTSITANEVVVSSLASGLEQFCREVGSDPFSREAIYISLITFGGQASQVPLAPITSFVVPQLKASGSTQLGSAFDLLIKSLEQDIVRPARGGRRGDWLPEIFLFLASQPTDAWRPQVQRLQAHPGKYDLLIGCAVGPDPSLREVLSEICSRVFAFGTPAASFVSLFRYTSQKLDGSGS
jgi:uncharacterized protein YegL